MQILGIWNEISYAIVRSLYGTVMKMYDFLIDISTKSSGLDPMTLAHFASNLYVVAGVFMLFRVILSMIQMIINPDQINDKQAGAGKLVTRIVLCIVMLMAFSPDGILFEQETGLFPRIEHALLAKDSIIHNLIKVDKVKLQKKADVVKPQLTYNIPFANYMYENVYAAAKKTTQTCYFIYKVPPLKNSGSTAAADFAQKPALAKTEATEKVAKRKYKIIFSKEKKSGYSKVENYKTILGSGKNGNLYVKFVTEKEGDLSFSKKPSQIKMDKSTQSKVTDMKNMSGFNCKDWSLDASNSKSIVLKYNASRKSGLWYGTGSLEEAKANSKEVSDKYEEFKNDGVISSSYSDDAVSFATAVIGSFQECKKDEDSCEDAKEKQFTADNNSDIVGLMDSETIDFDFFMSLLVGIGLILYFAILCVDVMVRGFKLALLQLLAPIPIISYVDPKDKIFNQWFKMYLSTFADLFIKLLAISLCTQLLTIITGVEYDSVLEKLMSIIAILVFVKLVPGMISKLFGLDNMSGSFKDIMGMGKAALGFGAGAAIGGAVGGATGRGIGIVTGALGGALKGAGSGFKGNVFGGAQAQAKLNKEKNAQKDDGLSLSDRMLVGMAQKTGMPIGQKAKYKADKAQAALSAQSDFKNFLKGEVQKKGSSINADAYSVGKFNQKGILKKGAKADKNGYYDADQFVTMVGEKNIDMKTEYRKKANLDGLSVSDWNSMSIDDRKSAFGELAGSKESLAEAQVFQNDRVVALEDYAIADVANRFSGDSEFQKEYGQFADTIKEAQAAGINIGDENLPKLGEFDNKTLSKVKDSALEAINEANDDSSIKLAKYTNTN